ncbi:MAG: superoxide dismutase, partial [Opitutae bacterium]|nr:superoxide dismutase [Opitutae bacterium]
MAYSLPALEYSTDSLEPHIDGRTMEIHHGKHHQTYVDKLNTALSEHNELSALGIENLISDISALPDSVKSAVRNNGGGHANHSFFWKCISP